jgi:glycosyltransferase involved in cell wall biosynthesis
MQIIFLYFSGMKIGFDAKRAFFNRTGLGNYSRSTITGLSQFFPEHEYHLYTPKPKKSKPFHTADNLFIEGPDSAFYSKCSSLWRTHGIPGQIRKDGIDLFHGLSNEIPYGIEKTGIPAVATICDIIFIHHPHLYAAIDRYIYRQKLENAIAHASKIITISKQTRDDLVLTCNVSEDKIDVVYLACASLYWEYVVESTRLTTIRKYAIPDTFILNVGTIERRKNILSVIKAMHKKNIDIPLVVIGKATPYLEEIKAFIESNGMSNIFFLHDVPLEDLPSFYQQAKLFVYPSIFEGFGMPILEAMVSRTPVIATRGGCFEEAGGPSTLYIDPQNCDEIGEKMKFLLDNDWLCDVMCEKGLEYAGKFKLKNIATATMNVYKGLI